MRTFVFAALVIGATVLFTQSAVAQSDADAQTESIELIVRPMDSATALLDALRSPLAKQSDDALFDGVENVRPSLPSRPSGKGGRSSSIPAFSLVVGDSTTLQTVEARWQARSDVAYAQRNVEYVLNDVGHSRLDRVRDSVDAKRSVVPENVLGDSLDHLRVVRAEDAWPLTRGDQAVSVGIVDSGIWLDHRDLQNQFAINDGEDLNGDGVFDAADRNGVDDDGNGFVDDGVGYDFVDRPGQYLPGEYVDRDPDPSPDPEGFFSGHGTAVAGVVASRALNPAEGVYGVAPGVRLVPLRAFGGDGRGQTDDIAAAIVYAADRGLDVLNLSFGRDRPSPLLEEAIRYAVARGTVVVGSAGNSSGDDPHYPSDYPEVLSVVWLAEDGRGLPTFSLSQYGIGADLGAPGSNVYTTQYPRSALLDGETLDVDDLYGPSSGSSFAAPQVAGAAALLRSIDPDLSPASIRSVLTGSAADLEEENWDHTTGAGRLDVANALARSLPARTELTRPEHNGGVTGEAPVPVVGSALDPGFASYTVEYTDGTRGLDSLDVVWTPITDAPVTVQVLRDTLATWDVTALEEGEYTLRLVTALRDGRTIEDRRRIVVDGSPPTLTPRRFVAGLIGGESGGGRVHDGGDFGVIADVESDDAVRLSMDVALDGRRATVTSEFVTRRNGLVWADAEGSGGTASVSFTATNRSGLTTTLDTALALPEQRRNTALLRREETSVPVGRLLPLPADFDDDGLLELVLNTYQRGRGISDTLRSFEWSPSGFAPRDTLLANVIPKDLGDTDADGRTELLTQVAAVTLLLEAPTPGAFPTQQQFLDDTGAQSPDDADALIGTLLTDLDRDGRGEIVGNNQTQWRILERRDTTYREVARLDNPTSSETIDPLQNANTYGTAEALDGDFDGDGRNDLLVGDRDGDWTVFESTGDDALQPVWSYETDEVDAGNRFVKGDVDGDGLEEFVTFTTTYPLPLDDNEQIPPVSQYYVWDAVGDNAYERVYRLPVSGEAAGEGGLATADLDADGRAEIVVAHPPSLYVVDFDADVPEWRVLFHTSMPETVLSRSLTPGDFDGDGTPEIVAGTTGDRLVRYVVEDAAVGLPPPRWSDAHPTGPNGVRLAWRAPDVDSVTLFEGSLDGDLNPVLTTADSSVTLSRTDRLRYALRATVGGASSPLSRERVVRPHAAATVASLAQSGATLEVTFTEPLHPSTRADQFALNGTTAPNDLLLGNGGQTALLRFDAAPAPGPATLEWTGVVDADGLAVGQTSATFTAADPSPATLVISSFDILDAQRVRLVFSEPLHPEAARNPSNYGLRPVGRVDRVDFTDERPEEVVVHLDGLVAGATGQESSLRVTDMEGASGAVLADEGRAVRLNEPATSLDDVFVFPNPYRASQHGSELTIAGLPESATIRIYTPDGRRVRVIDAESRTGGTTWDLRDSRGELVPSGVYLIRVEAPGNSAVLTKAAIFR